MNKITKAFKTEIYISKKQEEIFAANLNASRFAFNWALGELKKPFEENKDKPKDEKEKILSFFDLNKKFNSIKKELFPWVIDSPAVTIEAAIKDARLALDNFFRRCKEGKPGKKGFPKFKSRFDDKKSFRVRGSIKVQGINLFIPKAGKVKLSQKDYVPANAKILFVTISYHVGKWFASVTCEVDKPEYIIPVNDVVGVDLGIKSLAVCSDGTTYTNDKYTAKYAKLLANMQRGLKKKVKGSANRNKLKQKISKIHAKIASCRAHKLHNTTTDIVKRNGKIILEDLKVSNMLKNNKLAKAIADVGMFEFRRQITYKSEWNDRELFFVDTFFASSKTCSGCGHKKQDLKLSDRIFSCEKCGHTMDRDMNAAINIKNYSCTAKGSRSCDPY